MKAAWWSESRPGMLCKLGCSPSTASPRGRLRLAKRSSGDRKNSASQ